MKIAVAGGTGLTGRQVLAALHAGGHETVSLARSTGVDLATGAGLDDALQGVDGVVDVTNTTTMKREAAVAFFETGSRHLLAAEERAGVRHHVALSIVGVDRVDTAYYAGKLAQEEVVRGGAVPWTILRATQFHEFAAQWLEQVPALPIVPAPRMRSQPVAVAEVGRALAELAVAAPVGAAPDLAGPREEDMVDMVRRILRSRGRRALVVPIRLPGAGGRAMATGGLLPTGPGPRGVQTFDEWLAAPAVVG